MNVDDGFTGDITPMHGEVVGVTGEPLQMQPSSSDATADNLDSDDEEDIGDITYKIFTLAIDDNEEATAGMSFFR